MKKRYLLLTLLICFVSSPVLSQYSTDTVIYRNYENAGQYFGSYFTDGFALAKAPFKWQKRDWIIAGSTIAVGSLIYVLDDDIRDLIQRNRSGFTNDVSKNLIEPFGSGKYSIPLFGLLYLYGEIKDDQKSKRVALDGVKTFVFAASSAVVLKYIFKRHRPFHDTEANPRLWEGPFGNSRYTAFPSAHTAISFAMAAYLSSAYKDKLWVGISSYSIATLVGLSRINDDKHWGSDVFVGAVLGYAVGKCVFNKSLEKKNIKVLPVAGNGIGIRLVKTF